MIAKGETYKTKTGKTYEVVGKWNGDYVLAPREGENVLIYSRTELAELIVNGDLKRIK